MNNILIVRLYGLSIVQGVDADIHVMNISISAEGKVEQRYRGTGIGYRLFVGLSFK
jgi:hypothetical protein